MFSIAENNGGKVVLHDLAALTLNGHLAARLPADVLNRELREFGVPGVDANTGSQEGLLCLSRYQKLLAAADDEKGTTTIRTPGGDQEMLIVGDPEESA